MSQMKAQSRLKWWIQYVIIPLLVALIGTGFFAISREPNVPEKAPTSSPPAAPTQTATPQSNINITSHDQSGGFTGINQGTVNLGPQPRRLTTEQGNRMISRLASEKATSKINFSAVIGDEETKQYAEQINAVLIRGGFEYASVHTAGMAVGIPSGITIYVHDAKNPPRDAVRVADCFKAEGLHFNMTEGGGDGPGGAKLDANTFGIWVATRPTL